MMRACLRARLLGPLLLAGMVSACGWVGVGLDGSGAGGSETGSSRQSAAPVMSADGGRTVVVTSGDSVYGLAARHDATPRQVIALNGLTPPYDIQIGQRLKLPPKQRLHRVRAGETLGSISELYSVGQSRVAAANHMKAPFTVRSGEVIGIPGDGPMMASKPMARPARASEPGPVESRPLPASRPKPEMAKPEMAKPEMAKPTEMAKAPNVSPPKRPKTMTAAKPKPTATPKTNPVPTARVIAPAKPKVRPQRQTATAPARTVAPELATPGRTGGFLAPVTGRIIADFGSQADGRKNDGVNIAAPKGAPVRAAADGAVVYAGGALQGYGNLILLRHSDGWVTAYAHLDRILAKRGSRVVRGQAIGAVGSTGGVSTPQLHFEMRRNNQAVDPKGRLAAK